MRKETAMPRKRATSERRRIRNPLPQAQKTVKSASRALEILEYFDDVQRPATVMEVASALDYPQSSASALLRSLVNVGYLNYDRHKRTFITSNRVALLGAWINSEFFAEGAILSLMKELNERTGDTVLLATRNGLYMQYIHVIQATSAARLHVTLGTIRPMAASGAGYAFLSTMPDDEIRRLLMRINADREADQAIISYADLMEEIGRVRSRGYAFTYDKVTRGGGMLAAPIPSPGGKPPMIVGIGGISEVMRARETELAQILLSHIGSHLGVRRDADRTPF
jgi:DNA-binding IclR family transcriptional regulator